MKALALWKKEVRIGFASPIAYGLFTTFLFISGWFFYAIVGFAAQNAMGTIGPSNFSIMEMVFRPLFRNLAVILLFFTPAITMRLFAEEKRMGTIELLFTYPLSDLEILTGKFMASLSLLFFVLLPTVLYPVFISHFSKLEWGVVGMQYLGILFLGGCYLVVGLWISSLTENQVVAFFFTLGILLTFWIIGWVAQNFSASSWSEVVGQLSILNHFNNFSKGVLNTPDLSYYIFFILFFLYLTYKALESRSWQGSRE